MANRLYNRQVSPKGYKKGGRVNTGRMNLLEEVGRIDAERPNRNRRAEKKRVIGELKKGYRRGGLTGKKGIIQRAGEAISRKWRGKEKTEHKGLEQDKKTGAYTHNAPKDRDDTQAGRIHKFLSTRTGPAKFARIPKRYKSKANDMSYKERKKEIAKNKKEAKRKDDFDKKHKVGKYKKS